MYIKRRSLFDQVLKTALSVIKLKLLDTMFEQVDQTYRQGNNKKWIGHVISKIDKLSSARVKIIVDDDNAGDQYVMELQIKM